MPSYRSDPLQVFPTFPAGPGRTRQDPAGPGRTRHGPAWPGMAGMTRHGPAWPGMAAPLMPEGLWLDPAFVRVLPGCPCLPSCLPPSLCDLKSLPGLSLSLQQHQKLYKTTTNSRKFDHLAYPSINHCTTKSHMMMTDCLYLRT